jgi:hypothetical protein
VDPCRPAPPGGCSQSHPCDQNAIKNARAEYLKWLHIWQDQSTMEEQLSTQMVGVLQEGNAVFDEQFSVSEGITEITQESTFHQIEKAAETVGPESMAQTVGKALAIFTIAKMLSDMTATGAKMISKLNEAEKYAKQGASTAQAAADSLQRTNEAKEKLDQLEAACNSGSPSGDAKNQSAKANNNTPGTNSQSWQTIASAADDAINQMITASSEIKRALSAVQSAQRTSSPDAPGYGYSASRLSVKYMVGGASKRKLSPADMAKFVPAMVSAYTAIAKAGQDWDTIRSILTPASAASH